MNLSSQIRQQKRHIEEFREAIAALTELQPEPPAETEPLKILQSMIDSAENERDRSEKLAQMRSALAQSESALAQMEAEYAARQAATDERSPPKQRFVQPRD